MQPDTIHYDDWGTFIQMEKSDWAKVKRWLKTHGLSVEETGGDGPVTKYRKLKPTKRRAG